MIYSILKHFFLHSDFIGPCTQSKFLCICLYCIWFITFKKPLISNYKKGGGVHRPQLTQMCADRKKKCKEKRNWNFVKCNSYKIRNPFCLLTTCHEFSVYFLHFFLHQYSLETTVRPYYNSQLKMLIRI